MDTSEQYIKMCDCEEIQNVPMPIEQIPLQTVIRLASGKVVWLPRQDQLQEMITNPGVIGRLYDFYMFVHEDVYFPKGIANKERGLYGDEACHYFDSMEQLWLAFVMKEKHAKVWSGSEWKLS